MRSIVPLLFVAACSLQTGLSTPGHAGGACDAARNHCLPDGTAFMQGGEREGRRVRACVERDGVWYTVAYPDIVCEGKTLHLTDPTAAIEVGAWVIVYTPAGREPDGRPADEERARHGLWSRQKVASIDAEAGTFRTKASGKHRLAGARLVVESRAVE